MKTKQQTLQRIVGVAVLAAIIVVLQLVVGSIRVGPFNVTFSLIPIVLGAILFGPVSGALLGAVFGGIVCISVVTGSDLGGFLMFQQLPVLTLFLCVLKSTVAGLVSGLIWQTLQRAGRPKLAVTLAAIACPICNTGILSIGILTFFHDLATQWAVENDMANAFAFVILGMVGINFLLELVVNLIVTPALLRVVSAVRSRIA